MKLFLFVFCLLATFSPHQARKHRSDSSEEKPTPSPAFDRLAVNLAGALVKSLFPEMDRSAAAAPTVQPGSEVRRAPQSTNLFEQTGGPAFNSFAANMAPSAAVGSVGSVNDPSLHGPYAYPFAQPGQAIARNDGGGLPLALQANQLSQMIPAMPQGLGVGGAEGVNAARKAKYLAELQEHQQKLNEFNQKQMAYLDNMRRYEQQMLDHRAGAALLLQQQQQEFLNRQQAKALGSTTLTAVDENKVERKQPQTPHDFSTSGGEILYRSKNPALQKEIREEASAAFEKLGRSGDREDFASDAKLKEYFRTRYGIDIPNDPSELTTEERQTLRQLKEELVEQNRDGKLKDKDTFDAMDSIMKKVHSEPSPVDDLEDELATLSGSSSCAKCLPVELHKLRGSWTQIYGNPTVLRKTFSTIMSLERMEAVLRGHGPVTTSLDSRKASCIGMEIGKPKRNAAPMNYFFRDDGEQNELHEMNGLLAKTSSALLKMELSALNETVCVVKAGPAEVNSYEYIVLSETKGPNRCTSYHVFAKNTDEFLRRHYDDVADFMKTEVIDNNVMPVALIPHSELCEIGKL